VKIHRHIRRCLLIIYMLFCWFISPTLLHNAMRKFGTFFGPPGIHILQTIYGTSEETNSNCCTAAVAVYFWLVLPIICIATGTLQEKRMYWYGQVEACGSGLLQHWAEFQHCMVYYATKLEACINAEGCCHSEHLLWRCLPDLPAAIHHNRFFS